MRARHVRVLRGGDAGVGGDACHQLALGDADIAVGLCNRPVGQGVVEAGGLHPAVCFGTGQLAHVLDGGLRGEEPLWPERVVPVDRTGCRDGRGLDRTSELLDVVQPGAHLDRVELREIDVTQSSHRCGGASSDARSAFADRFGVDRLDQPEPDRVETGNRRQRFAAAVDLAQLRLTHTSNHDEGVSHTWENVVVRSFDAGLTPGVADRSLCPDSDLSAGVGRSGYAPAGRGGP